MTNNIKKIICLGISATVVATAFAGCSAAKTSGKEEHTVAVTEIVTNSEGEAVTDENGEVVTEVVTDKNGLPVTKVVKGDASSSTSANSSTAAKSNGTTKAGASSATKAGATNTTAKGKSSATAAQSKSESVKIVLEENRRASCSSKNVEIKSGIVTITKGGDYRISSSTKTWHGQIILKLKETESAEIAFENVTISNDSKNILQIINTSNTSDRSFIEAETEPDTKEDNKIEEIADYENAPKVSISFPQGTSSSFTTSANSVTGIIYNESKLTIKGRGSVSISGGSKNANNCICSTKSLTIKNVSINLTTAAHESTSNLAKTSGSAKGIFSYSKVNLESGKLTIRSNGDGIRCDSFNATGGILDLKSSACDGIDADDQIIISDGDIKSIALKKYSFKVRRVNNTFEKNGNKPVRSGKNDCFRIDGGTVWGESKKVTYLNPSFQSNSKGSKQASIIAKMIKKSSAADSKEANQISIDEVNKTSTNKCTKFLYSSSKIKDGGRYWVHAGNNKGIVVWHSAAGIAEVRASGNK